MLNPDFQPRPPFQSVVRQDFIKWVWLELITVITVKMMVKVQKKTINSSKLHAPLFGVEGDVNGVDGKTSPAQEEATKVWPKIRNTSSPYIKQTVKATQTRLTSPHCSHGCQQSYDEFLALSPLLFLLQAEQ